MQYTPPLRLHASENVGSRVQINPRDPDVFLACPNWGNPVIINIKDGTETVIEGSQIPDGSGSSNQSRPSKGYPEGIPRNYSACWESEGSLVYVGSSKGLITIWEYDPALKQIDTIQLPRCVSGYRVQGLGFRGLCSGVCLLIFTSLEQV